MPDPIHLSWSGSTHRGKVRPNNEDSFLALTFDGHGVRYLGKTGEAPVAGADFVFAVSDGMGGAKAGEFASRIAVDRITKLLPTAFKLSAAGMANDFSDILSELFSAIHRDLIALGNAYPECAGMGTTLTLAWFTPHWLYFAHLGDSRLYYRPAGGALRQLSEDHTHVGWLQRQGKINEREARTHPMKNSLQKALGAGHQFVDPQIGAVGYSPGDRFLLCTDGVIDGLWDRHFAEFLDAAAAPEAARIVDSAVDISGRDNSTALVITAAAPGARGLEHGAGHTANVAPLEPRAPCPAPGAARGAVLFVYGTLKRSGSNHAEMAGQRFIGEARTAPGFRLFDLGEYPGMVAVPDDGDGVTGELWEVDATALGRLDVFEGVPQRLFRRDRINLSGARAGEEAEAYIFAGPVNGRRVIGSSW